MTKVKDWVSTCCEKHTTICQPYRNKICQKPTRLLHVSDGSVKLITVDKNESYRYVTVSHRWDDKVLMLTQEAEKPDNDHRWIDVTTLQAGIPVDNLSHVFEKAIEIVRVCGFHYIWIDSLCIIQDIDKNDGPRDVNKDWENEARKMGDIYAGGVLYVFRALVPPIPTLPRLIQWCLSICERGRIFRILLTWLLQQYCLHSCE